MAYEAFRIGFVSRVSRSDESLFDMANEVVSQIVRHSPVAVAVTKTSLNYSREHSVTEGL
jgi:delta(3,5)-delta(2,4)-dienoyl-CoA isomerase